MEELVGLLVAGGVIVGVYFAAKEITAKKGESKDQPVDPYLGAARHHMSGERPTVCSWCRKTALAKRMTVFDLADGEGWRAVDLYGYAQQLPPKACVEFLIAAFDYEMPARRRL